MPWKRKRRRRRLSDDELLRHTMDPGIGRKLALGLLLLGLFGVGFYLIVHHSSSSAE